MLTIVSFFISVLLEAYGLWSAEANWQTLTSSQLASFLPWQHMLKQKAQTKKLLYLLKLLSLLLTVIEND